MKFRWFGVLLLGASALLGGCLGDRTLLGTKEMGLCPGQYALKLDVVVPTDKAVGTRAAGHEEENGTAAESYIDMYDRDFHILIFGEDGRLLFEMTPPNADIQQSENEDGFTVYMLETIIEPGLVSDELKSAKIMALANWNSFGGGYTGFDGTRISGTTGNLYKNGTDFNFSMPDASGEPWKPSIENKHLIPMFGVSGFTVEGDASTLTSKIKMLRSLAKVEIVDNTKSGIGSVSLSKSSGYGRFIPDVEANPDWSATGVTTPSLPSKLGDIDDIAFYSETRTVGGTEKTVWTAYIPEMHVASALRPQDSDGRPSFDVTLKTGTTKSFKFDNYYNGEQATANKLESILRNHIYRYNVEVKSAEFVLNLEVLPWDMMQEENEWHFDLPTVDEEKDGWLKWKTTYTADDDPDREGDPNGYNDKTEDLTLIMKTGTDDYAEATFTLSAPLNAKWIATLVPLQGDHNAFSFDEGYDSGTIDGEPATIRIRNNSETVSDENNEARLVIMVEYPDKTQKEAVVVKPVVINDKTVKNYTIVQELTEIGN